MQNKQTLVETAYKFLCKKKKSSFNEIWNHIKKQYNITKEDEEKSAGELYTGMILDTNFFLKNDKLWYPRSEVSLEEIKEQMTRIDISHKKTDSIIKTLTLTTIENIDLDKIEEIDEEIDEDLEEEIDEEEDIETNIKINKDNYDE